MLKLIKEQYSTRGGIPTVSAIAKELGLPGGYDHLVSSFMRDHMKTISRVTEDNLISWLTPYAKRVIKQSKSAYDLLKKIHYDQGITADSASEINSRIEQIFGESYKKAKITHTTGYIDND